MSPAKSKNPFIAWADDLMNDTRIRWLMLGVLIAGPTGSLLIPKAQRMLGIDPSIKQDSTYMLVKDLHDGMRGLKDRQDATEARLSAHVTTDSLKEQIPYRRRHVSTQPLPMGPIATGAAHGAESFPNN